MSPILDSIGSVKAYGWGRVVSLTSFESIATVSVGSGGQAAAEFTSIPSNFNHLQVRMIGRTTGSNYDIYYQLNNDTTSSNYRTHLLFGTGSSFHSVMVSNAAYAGDLAPSTASSGVFGGAVLDFLDYANTNKYKTSRSLSGIDSNNAITGYIILFSSLWQNTNAITSIKIFPATGSWAQYSHFALYGIKGAA